MCCGEHCASSVLRQASVPALDRFGFFFFPEDRLSFFDFLDKAGPINESSAEVDEEAPFFGKFNFSGNFTGWVLPFHSVF